MTPRGISSFAPWGALVALVLGPPAAPAGAGDVVGTVLLPERPGSRGVSVDLYSKYARPAEDPGPGVASGAIGLVRVGAPPPALTNGPPPVMDQRGARFVPRVVPVRRGGSVSFLNSDPVFHNVFSLSPTRKFDLGRYPKGDSRLVRFERPGVVQVFCDIHAEMYGFVVVFETPHFAVLDAEGRFRVEGLPEGTYDVLGWAEGRNQFETLGRLEVPEAGAVEFRGELSGAR